MRGGTEGQALNLEKIRADASPQGLLSAGKVCELLDKTFERTISKDLISLRDSYGKDAAFA